MPRAGWFAVLALVGCAEPRSVPVIGPDGARQFHVSCGGDEAKCFELAGQDCPGGYQLWATPGRNYLVRCREAGFVAAAARDNMLAPSPYVMVPGPGTQMLAPNPYRPPAPGAGPPVSTASFPPLSPPPARSKSDDLGY